MKLVGIDIEAFSTTDLRQVGAYKYAEDTETRILCISAMSKDFDIFWKEGEQLPSFFYELVDDPEVVFIAHNAHFEMEILNGLPGQNIQFPTIPLERWRDTAALCRYYGLPAKLEDACIALGLPMQKDKIGHAVMMRLSKPRRPSKTNKDIRWTPETKPAEFDRLYRYCKQDVRATLQLYNHLLPYLPNKEDSLYKLDYLINKRGFPVDVAACTRMIELRDSHISKLEKECINICGFRSSQRDKVISWAKEKYNFELKSYTKNYLLSLLSFDIPVEIKRVIQIRLLTGKVSLKKIDKILKAACKDGRLRGCLLYYGAGTGRFSGRIFQPQNIKRGSIKNVDQAMTDIAAYDFDSLEVLYGSVPELLSSCIRALIKARNGYELVIADYSSIESRTLHWLAGCVLGLDTYSQGKDIYVAFAAKIFGCRESEVTADQRFLGKVAVLGLGYKMGSQTFYRTCRDAGLDYVNTNFAHKIVSFFRSTYFEIPRLWKKVGETALNALRIPDLTRAVNNKLSFKFDTKKDCLIMDLPSGRQLFYSQPKIEIKEVAFGDATYMADTITFFGLDTYSRKWCRTMTYSGKLVENAVQAIARDILTEAMLSLDVLGYQIILTVHDEIIIEAPVNQLSARELEDLMCVLPQWAAGLPIKAEGFNSVRYKK